MMGALAAFNDVLDFLFCFVDDLVCLLFLLEEKLHARIKTLHVQLYFLAALSDLADAIDRVPLELRPSVPTADGVDRCQVVVTHD